MKKRIMFLCTAVLLAWGISGCAGNAGRETARESGAEGFESDETETRTEKSAVEREWNQEEENGNMASTDFWTFELPEGWEKSIAASTDNEYIFAPGGNIAAESVVYISGGNSGEDVSSIRDMDEDDLVEAFEILLGSDADIDNISVVGDTAIGYAVKIKYKEQKQRFNAVSYIIFEDQSVYVVAAFEDGKGTEAFEAAEYIINTAKVK